MRMKIAFVGAGSLGFTRTLVIDMMSWEDMQDAHIALIDIDKQRLDYAHRAVNRIMEVGQYPAKVEATLDRAEGLKDADIVITTILAHGADGFRPEIDIPMKYGVDFNVGDTHGTAAVFRALRTIPMMLDICRDIERHAPNAYLLNYTNPMSMLCRAMQRETSVRLVGLCHSVQGLGGMLASWIGAPRDEIVCACAGINHQAWAIRFEWNGKDAYPLLREAMQRPEIYRKDIVRNEMFLALGYYVTESSGHNSEYNWWFRKRPELIEKYCMHGENWNPGRHRYILDEYEDREQAEKWQKSMEDYGAGRVEIKLGRSHEYASSIVRGLLFDEVFEFNATVANAGLITNLPDQCAVEVPVIATKTGFGPIHVGALPIQCAALNQVNTAVNELAVEAAINGDPQAAYHACCYDPLAASALSLAEIRQMVDELFKVQAPLLPQFKHLT
ncbi:MAG: alpha-glucosidase/alpha-galactosidase [Armatimonadota bacterium]|nr:MAG: alpha-glucosidase/alpha-galactosidase [Armatimonadota bacterium]